MRVLSQRKGAGEQIVRKQSRSRSMTEPKKQPGKKHATDQGKVEINDLDPQTDPKGGTHPPVPINLNLSDGSGLGAIAVGHTAVPDDGKVKPNRG